MHLLIYERKIWLNILKGNVTFHFLFYESENNDFLIVSSNKTNREQVLQIWVIWCNQMWHDTRDSWNTHLK